MKNSSSDPSTPTTPILLAGYPDRYPNVYHKIHMKIGDMTVYFNDLRGYSAVIVRNIEIDRTKQAANVIDVFCPEDLVPAAKLSSNRNISFAQAAAELLKNRNITEVVSDQMLPLLFVDILGASGISIKCDLNLGIIERRMKDAREIGHLRNAQKQTESAINYAYEIIRDCDANNRGELIHAGSPLTSDRLRAAIAKHLMDQGFGSPYGSIVAGGPQGADCHHSGEGVLHEGQPIILDVFPIDITTRYHGDCTRTLCRGIIPELLIEMHEAVLQAKKAAFAACSAAVTGAEVHNAAVQVFRQRGYHIGLPHADAGDDTVFYPHGTGHGIGLEVHEPPLLDDRGEQLVEGDVVTIEPALYCKSVGGVRVEDMGVVRADYCENLNSLNEGLWW